MAEYMTDRDIQKDRLKKLLKEADESASNKLIMDYDDAIDDNADYLLANGVIVPPCKVGDTVWEINTKYPKSPFVNKFIVIAFHITSGKNILGHKKPSHIVVRFDYMPSLTKIIYLENFGKTVFLTKEEAEKVLAERSGDNC